jgi:hypothetical protein
MPVIIKKNLIEGMERNEGKFRPGESTTVGGIKDPGFGSRRETIETCDGYVDPRDGKKKVAPGHKAKFIVFTQDAPQTSRCDSCQLAFRSAYKMAHKKAKANRMPFTPKT